MTIIAAYIDETRAVIGCDSGFTMGNLKANMGTSKVITYGDPEGLDTRPSYVGVAGGAMAFQYADGQLVERPTLNSAADIPVWVEGWVDYCDRRGFQNKEDGSEPAHFIVLTPREPFGEYCVIAIDSEGTTEVLDTQHLSYWAIGTGGEVAMGAFAALTGSDLDAEERVERAVEAAIKHANNCNPPAQYWSVAVEAIPVPEGMDLVDAEEIPEQSPLTPEEVALARIAVALGCTMSDMDGPDDTWPYRLWHPSEDESKLLCTEFNGLPKDLEGLALLEAVAESAEDRS